MAACAPELRADGYACAARPDVGLRHYLIDEERGLLAHVLGTFTDGRNPVLTAAVETEMGLTRRVASSSTCGRHNQQSRKSSTFSLVVHGRRMCSSPLRPCPTDQRGVMSPTTLRVKTNGAVMPSTPT